MQKSLEEWYDSFDHCEIKRLGLLIEGKKKMLEKAESSMREFKERVMLLKQLPEYVALSNKVEGALNKKDQKVRNKKT